MSRVYISGPVTGDKDAEIKFKARAASLRAMGYQVCNPIEVGKNLERMINSRTPTYFEYMREDLKALLECDCINMLDDWKKSFGSRIEHAVAVACGIKILRVKILNPSWKVQD